MLGRELHARSRAACRVEIHVLGCDELLVGLRVAGWAENCIELGVECWAESCNISVFKSRGCISEVLKQSFL